MEAIRWLCKLAIFARFLAIWEDKRREVEKLAEKLKLNEPPGPPFKPLKKYVDDEVIYEISFLIINLIENSLKKSGYVIRKEKKDELVKKYYTSITGWGTESNFFFSYIGSGEFISKTFFRTIFPFFRKKFTIVSDLSSVIDKVLEQLDFPQIKEWLDNEYRPYKKYKEYRRKADLEMSMLLDERKLDNHRNVSSSPISDARLKEKVKPITNALKRVLSMQGVEYVWRENEFKDIDFSRNPTIGFIAQDLEKLEPSIVFVDDSGFKAIHYGNIVSLLAEAIKEQQVEINDLKNSLNFIKDKGDRQGDVVDKTE